MDARVAGGLGDGDEFAVGCSEFRPTCWRLAEFSPPWKFAGRECPIHGAFCGFKGDVMDVLYLLIPLSVVLVLLILAGLWWAVDRGQFDSLEQEGERILRDN